MSDGEIKLVYFDARGRGEVCRLLLAASGKPWQDVRLTFQQWPAEKPNTPFQQLPCLEYGGKRYGQSGAIAKFLARELGYFGKSNLDGLRIMEVMELATELGNAMAKAKFEKDPVEKEENMSKLEESIPQVFQQLERLLQENTASSGFFVGDSVTLADLVAFELTFAINQMKPGASAAFPLLEQLRERVVEVPTIKAYLADRKDTEF